MLKQLAFAAAVLTGTSTVSSVALAAGHQDFSLHNDTHFVIGELHIALANQDKWGPDVLGADTLGQDGKAHIKFTGYKDADCIFDVRIRKDNDGPFFLVEDLNLCEIDDVVFYSKDGKVLFRKE